MERMATEEPKKQKPSGLPDKIQIGTDYEISPPTEGAKIVAVSGTAGWAQDLDNRLYICHFPRAVPTQPVTVEWHLIPFEKESARIMAAAATFENERHALFVYTEDECCIMYSVNRDNSNARCQSALIPCNAMEEAEFIFTKTLAATITIVDIRTILASFNDSLTHFHIRFTDEHNTSKDLEYVHQINPQYARNRSRMTNIFIHQDTPCVAFFGADYTRRRQTVCIYDFTNDRAIMPETFMTEVLPKDANLSPYVTAYAITRPGVGTGFILSPLEGLTFCLIAPTNEIVFFASVDKDTIGYIGAMAADPRTAQDVCIMNVSGNGYWLNVFDDIFVQMTKKGKKKHGKQMPARNLYKKYGIASMYNRDAESILKFTPEMIVLHQSEARICLLTLDFDGDAPTEQGLN